MSSENGWNPARVGADACEWVTVPGTNVTLQLLKGWPLQVMRAYAADYNAYVEPLRDPDSAGWTPTNSVATSNHLNGTAMDLNWDSHPFRVSLAGYTPQMVAVMREMLAFYNFEGLQIMFWAQDWNTPKDCMHHQMGYDTWNNPLVGRFIDARIRADGFSSFRRDRDIPQPQPPQLSRVERYALAIIVEGRRLGISPRGIKIALSVALVETNLTMYANSNVPESLAKNPDGSDKYPHEKVGSDHDSTGLFQQRQAWGPLACTMNATCSAGLFYNGGNAGQRGLTDFDYNNMANSPGVYAQRVQVSAFPDRYDQRFAEATALYDKLSTPAEQPTEDWLNMPSNQEKLDAIYNALFTPFPPEHIYRQSSDIPPAAQGQNLVDSIKSILSIVTEGTVERLGLLGEPASIDKVVSVAKGQAPEQRPWALARANLIWTRGKSGQVTAARIADTEVAAVTNTPPAPHPMAPLPELLPALPAPTAPPTDDDYIPRHAKTSSVSEMLAALRLAARFKQTPEIADQATTLIDALEGYQP